MNGLFAYRDLEVGEILVQYTGDLLSQREANLSDSDYLFACFCPADSSFLICLHTKMARVPYSSDNFSPSLSNFATTTQLDAVETLANTKLSSTSSISVQSGTDGTTHAFGRARIHAAVSDRAQFSHQTNADATSFAFSQSGTGKTVVNCGETASASTLSSRAPLPFECEQQPSCDRCLANRSPGLQAMP